MIYEVVKAIARKQVDVKGNGGRTTTIVATATFLRSNYHEPRCVAYNVEMLQTADALDTGVDINPSRLRGLGLERGDLVREIDHWEPVWTVDRT